ncbi:MAG: signal peptidase I [Oscillospiraceae bacterium]|nr:signal peptidase I [Oscillospiraceae bacterium]
MAQTEETKPLKEQNAADVQDTCESVALTETENIPTAAEPILGEEEALAESETAETSDAAIEPETETSPEETTEEPDAATESEETIVQPESEKETTQQSSEPQEPIAPKSNVSVKGILGDVCDLMESIITSVFVVLLVFTFLFCVATVEGESMLPTLRDDDRLVVTMLDKPEPGDVIIVDSRTSGTFQQNGELVLGDGLGKRIVKRLIAVGGQKVMIDFAEGIVYVDDVPLQEDYTSTLTTRDEGAFTYPITVPEGYVFVLGDNRSISKDSRHPEVGLIPESDIVGKVWLRVYPLMDFTLVE